MAARTELQNFLAKAVERADKTRDHFDGLLRQKLATTGKPLWDIERGKVRKPSPRVLRAIEEVLSLPADQLVDMVHPREAPRLHPDQQPTRSSDAGDGVEIRKLDLSVAMGRGTLIEDFVQSEMVTFDAAELSRITRTPSDRLRFVTGVGNSHEPRFQSNDQFLIDINQRELTRIDGYYWITFDGAHALKRLRPLGKGQIQILSDNPDFDPIEAARSEVRIEGRAIWFARGL